MSLTNQTQAINDLKNSFNSRNLSIYLGAGVSIPSGLPSWEQLVLLMYFQTLNADVGVGVYSNYLLAMADWLLKKRNEPLDMVIRKIRNSGWTDKQLLDILWKSLYSGFLDGEDIQSQESLVNGNQTLLTIVDELCVKSNPGTKGLRSVVTYNYDNLLELGIKQKKVSTNFRVVHNNTSEIDSEIPIYHVHGYVPIEKDIEHSSINELVFSEEQYNNVYQDSYYWGNMVQMQNLSSYTGLFIGVSMTDRNIRRILDAIKKSPIKTKNYWLVKKQTVELPKEGADDIDYIRKIASENLGKLQRSGIKKPDEEFQKVYQVMQDILQFEAETFNKVYKNLGLEVLLYDNHEEVPEFIKKITL